MTADRARHSGGDQRFRGSAQMSVGPGRSSRGTMLDRLTYTRRRVTRPAHEGRARVAVVGRVVSRPVRRTWLSSVWVPEGAGDPRFAQAIIGGSSPCSESLSTSRPVREPTSKLRSTSSSTTRPWLVRARHHACPPVLLRVGAADGLTSEAVRAPEPPRSSIVDWVQPVKPLYRCRDWHLGGAPPGSGG